MKAKELIVNTSFLDSVKQPIFVKNEEGIYIYCNESFSNFVGVPIKKIINHTAFDISPQSLAKIYTEADREMFRDLKNQAYLSKIQNQSNSTECKVIFKKTILYDQNNKLSGFIGTIELHQDLFSSNLILAKKLSEREMETLNLLAQGKSTKQIASILMISPHTVTDYMKSIYIKLDAHSKGEAIFKALSFWSSKPD